jgi:hypothetical protein
MKKIKSIYRYSIANLRIECIFSFAIITAIVLVLFSIGQITGSSGGVGAIDILTYLFILIFFFSSYRENINFLTQFGVSRKTFFAGMAAVILTMGIICGIATTLVNILGNFLESKSNLFAYESFYEQIFHTSAIFSSVIDSVKMMFLNIGICLFFAAAGFFMGAFCYRFSKIIKIITVCTVALLIILLAWLINSLLYIDIICFNGVLFKMLSQSIDWTFNCWIHLASVCAVGAAIIFIFSGLFIKRCPVLGKSAE